MTTEYLDGLLSTFPDQSRRTAQEIVAGFQDAIDQIEDINMEDMDEAYTMLYQNLLTMDAFQGNNDSLLAAITLAKFFLDHFNYMPSKSIDIIKKDEKRNNRASRPSSHTTGPSNYEGSGKKTVPSTKSSMLPTSSSHVRSQKSSSHVESSTKSAHLQSRRDIHMDNRSQSGTISNPYSSDSFISSQSLSNSLTNTNTTITDAQQLPVHLTPSEIMYRAQIVQNAQIAAVNAAVASGQIANASHIIGNASNMLNSANLNRLPTTLQHQNSVTLYGPNGQPGIPAQLPSSIISTMSQPPTASSHYNQRPILPRPPAYPTPVSQTNQVTHNLPLQLQPQRPPFR